MKNSRNGAVHRAAKAQKMERGKPAVSKFGAKEARWKAEAAAQPKDRRP